MPDLRHEIHDILNTVLAGNDAALRRACAGVLDPACVFEISHPLGRLEGLDDIIQGFYDPLRAALRHVYRRDEIFIGGANRRAAGGQWIATVTHYVGTFDAAFFGMNPSGRLAFLRAGEFYRVANGRITQARIILDLPDLMRQAGRDPFGGLLGLETLFPGPATHDGVLPQTGDGSASLDLVEAMLGDLHLYDPTTGASRGQTGPDGYWAEDMMWYGPCGIGSNYRWEGFVKDHRAPFLSAFPDRKGGNHYCRIGDGNYAAISGWPSMTMTHQGSYLGVPPTGQRLTLRVMDFYRCAGGKIAENWVLLDYMDLMDQMGVDLIARSNAMSA
ncbi:nuclear transport factor 2 family protein [Roseobacter sinensis]|uniref:Ester cyclase n=1 Tax=Roseobacter sinensis TaxID=2931391 RepID=A0ABT3BAC2_9RHOB|nr:ester cyclase [Roseobacter sp. WL0113]MCV3270521.1 ester cyclase [Roseobacter sp. WL0113]